MSKVNTIKIYEARSPADQTELLRLTEEELKVLPKPIVVHIRNTSSSVTVIAIEPEDHPWDWPPKFNAFTVSKGDFTLRQRA